jgi:5'-methylthioadenosine phosphorylase
MGRLAVIGGHSILGHEPGRGMELDRVETDYGEAELLVGESHVLLQRHGLSRYRTAARIDHRANLAALERAGCDRALAIGSVGSLRAELEVGTFLCPDDFIALQLGVTFWPDRDGERVPGFEAAWRQEVVASWRRHSEGGLREGGTYWQTIGPRFETPAEIRMIAAHADVVGMTIASECVLAGELGIRYAAICVVDNLANGVGEAPLSVEEFEAGKAANRARLLAALEPVIGDLSGGVR